MRVKKNIYQVLYFFFIVSYYLIGRMSVPGIGINFILLSGFFMILGCLMMDREIWIDKILVLYLLFSLIRLFSAAYYGYLDEVLNLMINKIPVGYVLCWSSMILTKRTKGWMVLVIPLIAIGILNSFITACQSYGISMFDEFVSSLNVSNEFQDEYLMRHGDRFGLAVSGLFGTAVNNGHISLLIILSWFLMKGKVPIFVWIIPLFILYLGLFFCQQRSAFILASFFGLLLFLKTSNMQLKGRLISLFIVILIVVVSYYTFDYLGFSETRMNNLDLYRRNSAWANSLVFINEHFLVGSYELFTKQQGISPHNFLLSAFIGGGLIGGLIFVTMCVLQCKMIYKYWKRNNKSYFVVLSCLYLAITFDSLFHNTGLVEYNGTTLLAWGLVCGAAQNKQRYYENNVCN